MTSKDWAIFIEVNLGDILSILLCLAGLGSDYIGEIVLFVILGIYVNCFAECQCSNPHSSHVRGGGNTETPNPSSFD